MWERHWARPPHRQVGRMLNLTEVQRQLARMVQEQAIRKPDFGQKVGIAVQESKRWVAGLPHLTAKIAQSKTSWLVARFDVPICHPASLTPRPNQWLVFASDGSQIFPDRHEAMLCYLINIGSVVLPYGINAHPQLTNRPHLFYRESDLYQRWGGRRVLVSEEIVSVRRHLMEVEELARLARTWKFRPAVALLDGTLILWTLEGKPADFRALMLRRFLKALDVLREKEVPICGYISNPGSTDVINALRIGLCPYPVANCDKCEWLQSNKVPPCAVIEGVTDAHLFERLLKPGERSPIFWSSSQILADYGDHRIAFFYLHAGMEIARIELPQWVAENEEWLNLVHAVVYDQVVKGRGYPVALAEAHEQAVVRGAERELFYEMLEAALIRQGFKVSMTFKLLTKRVPTI